MLFFVCRKNQQRELLHLSIYSSFSLGAKLLAPQAAEVCSAWRKGLDDFLIYIKLIFLSMRGFKQPILTAVTRTKEILYELESVR